MAELAIGIDLGGTNLKGIVMDREGNARCVERTPTEAHLGGEHVLDNILQLVAALIGKIGGQGEIAGVGIGSPGFIDSDGTVIGGAENLPGWQGTQVFLPIKKRFELRAAAANDVTAMALAESRFGAGRGVANMVCLALGTGIGGGIVLNGRLYKGSHGMAGELGHISVETDGIQCNCGLKGCVEQYASATGIANLASQLHGTVGEPSRLGNIVADKSEPVTSKLVYEFVAKRDPLALLVHRTACRMLARACGIICNAFAPDRIVLGGGVLEAGDIIVDEVSKHVPDNCWPGIWERCDIARAECGEDAGALGAAALVFEEFTD